MKKKKCNGCNSIKIITDFNKDKNRKDGHQQWCRLCHKNFYHTPKGKRARRGYPFKSKYGITPDEHHLMYILQNGKCAICKQHVDYDKTHTDHNHKTGKVRDLLCRRCNVFLSGIENKIFLERAIKYLEKHDGV